MDATCAPPVEDGCCPEWSEYDPALRARASDLAWMTLRHLTAGRTGNCPVELRPCVVSPCNACSDFYGSYSILNPRVVGGNWTNVSCNPKGCSCDPLSEVVLPGDAYDISVWVDGEQFGAWKRYGNIIVRTDGDPWPSCQDLKVDGRKPGAFAVMYTPGVDPGPAGMWAYSTLACEFAKACCGSKCRLPSSVVSLSRQGVSMQFDNSMFSNGMTGIREVDAFIVALNPNKLSAQPLVWSPDIDYGRWAR